MMGEDLIKFRGVLNDQVYQAYRIRVAEIENLIPRLNDMQRVSLMETSMLSLL